MSDQLAPGGDESAPAFNVETVPAPASDAKNPRDLANFLTDYRNKRDAKEDAPAAPEPAAAEPETPIKDAAPAEEATSETETTEAEPAAEPTIEPPRSWTKEEKAEFATYPRSAQEVIARREQDRESALRKGQNEHAEKLKGLTAKEQQVEQARQQYEAALPQLLQTLQEQQQGEFSDIKTMNDVEKLAREDWPRYALWDAQQKKIAAVSQEMQASQQRQQEEFKSKWSEFSAKEDAKFLELAPEMSDKEKATKVADSSVALLKDLGFGESDLAKLWNGEASVSLRDHRVQLLIRDAARYRDAIKEAPKKIVAKPVAKVQRPGTSQSRAGDDDVAVKNLENKLTQSGSWKDAAHLLMAKRSAR
jgi:hypothetical protein